MPTIIETAHIVIDGPGQEAGDIVHNSWLLWKSALEESKRRGGERRGDRYVLRGAMSGHVIRLWPTLDPDARTILSRSLYAYLRTTGQAICVHKANPTVWYIAPEWTAGRLPETPTVVFRSPRTTPTERRLTPEEAGETLPPGEVTIRQKETPVPATTASAEKNQFIQDRVKARTARLDDVVEFVNTIAPEPVVAEEVAHFLDVNVTTARTDLNDLIAAGRIFSRDETPEERRIRFGAVAFARRAQLYWGKKSIPPRTMRVVVDGYEATRSERRKAASKAEINRRLWMKLKKKGNRGKFSAISMAACTKLGDEAIRNRLRQMQEAGFIERAGIGEKGASLFRVKDMDGVRRFLGQPADDEVIDFPAPKAVATPAAAAVPTPTVSDDTDLITVPRAEVIELVKRKNALEARVTELEQQLTAASTARPTVVTSLSDLI